jgi:hypothetical protein
MVGQEAPYNITNIAFEELNVKGGLKNNLGEI